MICNQCNTANNDDARFCSNCGAELPRGEQGTQSHKTRDCPSCGYENEREARYCAECGVELRHHQSQPHHKHHYDKQHPPKKKKRPVDTRLKWNPALVVILIIAGAVIFLAIPYITGKPPGQKPQPVLEQTSGVPAIETTVREIASKFICSCGTCGEQPLDVCTCGTAVQERNFIRKAVQSGQSKELVIAAVNSTFGWMKPEFATRSDSVAGAKGRASKLTVPKKVGENALLFPKPVRADEPATLADQQEIYSHFKCPCGQCGIDELKDCNCNHPKGAQEVKAFTVGKIRDGKYTVADVMGEIEKKYGGRKF